MGTKETTSTSTGTGDEVNKDSDLIEILKDGRAVLDHYGPEYLKPEQLLDVLISPGYSGKTAAEVAANLLKAFGDLKDVVTASIPQLTKVKGIGFVKACQIKAAFELSKRVASYCEEDHPVIASIDDVVKLLAPHMLIQRFLSCIIFPILPNSCIVWIISFICASLLNIAKRIGDPPRLASPVKQRD